MALRPSSEGWLCRSKRPADGSTPPRRRCSLAGLQAEWLELLSRWPEGPLDLKRERERTSRLFELFTAVWIINQQVQSSLFFCAGKTLK